MRTAKIPAVSAPPSLDLSVRVFAPLPVVLRAFFDPDALGAWWNVRRSVTIPRPFGPYVVEWDPTLDRDELLGRLGGVFRGTVVQYNPGRGFFVGDAFWLPPDGDPIGPMAFEVTCTPAENGASTDVHVSQRGYEESERWRRYYELIEAGWERALASMRSLLEK
jgi:uncharacterized protein YndB with AHSA1/START domain